MPMIETEIWKPNPDRPGTVVFDSQRLARDVFNDLEKHLIADGRLPDEYFLLSDYPWGEGALFPKDAEILASAGYGGSEGVYMDVSVRYQKEIPEFNETTQAVDRVRRTVTEHFATGKTLGEGLADLDKMNLVAASVMAAFYGGKEEIRERYAAIENGREPRVYPLPHGTEQTHEQAAPDTPVPAMPEMMRKLMLRELAKNGFPQAEYMPETGQIKIPMEGKRPFLINADGGVLYMAEHRDMALNVLRPLADRAREIAAAWDGSREMPVGDLPEFRLLAEYNNIVLAARDDTELGYGLHYVTWEYNYERTGMIYGHYTTDYDGAKEDFAVRAGLVREDKLFTQKEAAELRDAAAYRLEQDWKLPGAGKERLEAIAAKLHKAYPVPESEKNRSKKPSIGDKLREGKEKSDAGKAKIPPPASKNRAAEID